MPSSNMDLGQPEVEAQEAGRAEILAVGEAQSVRFEGGGGVVQAQSGDVEPSEIGAFNGSRSNAF